MTRSRLSFIESLRCIFRPAISREDAIELAREECRRRGYPVRDPVKVRSGLLVYGVLIGGDLRGGSPCVSVDKRDGSIRRVWVSTR
jgi:hypothetical protein